MSNQVTVMVQTRSAQRSDTGLAFASVWLTAALLTGLSLWMLRPPSPVPASASAHDFSAERAMADVRTIARTPHPIGSQANAAVRDYLVGRLTALNMAPQIFSGMGLGQYGGRVVAGNVEDIVGRMQGSANSRAVLLVAHYDSVSRAPGAGDDGAAVAALLETLRVLHAGPVLKNDIIVLFTDGEEVGSLGADAFIHLHPWMKDVGFIMNFEARGNQGVSLLFETSADNEALVRQVARVAPQPFASSLFYALYKLLPNDTDFTLFRRTQVPGLNFAFGAGLEAYHSALDTPQNLSAASLQHHGSYALALSRYFGNIDLARMPQNTGDAVFFNPLGGELIWYPERWTISGEILLTALVAIVVVMGLSRKRIAASKVFLGAVCSFVLVVVLAALLAAVWWVFSIAFGRRLIRGDSPSNALLLMGLIFLGLLCAVNAFRISRRLVGGRQLCFGGLIIATALNWVLALRLAAGSYLLLIPTFLLAAGLLVLEMWPDRSAILEFLGGVPATTATILLYAPLLYLVYVFMTLQVVTAEAAGFLLGLIFIVAVPVLNVAVPSGGKFLVWLNAVLCTLTVGCLIGGLWLSHPSARHPRFDTIVYSLNADEHSAAWLSYDQALDPWTSKFFAGTPLHHQPMPDYLGGVTRPVWTGQVAPVDLAAPQVEIQAKENIADQQLIHLRILSRRNASTVYLRFDKSTRVSAVDIAGRHLPVHQPDNEPFSITLYGLKQDGLDLSLNVKGSPNLIFWAMDESNGLPSSFSRPLEYAAWYGSDITLVCRKYVVNTAGI